MHALAGQRVIVIDNTKKNLGYGGAANKGIRKALKEGAEWAVVMNQDLTISRGGIETFVNTLGKSLPGIAGPFAGSVDRRRWTTILNKNVTNFFKATPCKSQGSGLGERYYISGSLMAVHWDVWQRIGGFYEPYFMYYEDVDYCIRAKKAGFPLMHTPIDGIKHNDHPFLGKGSFLHEYYLARNHLLFVERQAPVRVNIYELFRLPKTLYEHIKRRSTGALMGILYYIFRRFGPY